jgi:hypothetical protein
MIQQKNGEAASAIKIDQRLKNYVNWTFFVGAALYGTFRAGFVIWLVFHGDRRLLDTVYKHFAAIVGLRFAGFAALGLVLLLESRSDQSIKVKAPGFKFYGPLVLSYSGHSVS